MSRTALYRLFDATGRLLYVGISRSVVMRMADHSRRAWWPNVHSTTFEIFADRAAAADAEREAIRSEQPLHNVVHSTIQPRPSWPLTDRNLFSLRVDPDLIRRIDALAAEEDRTRSSMVRRLLGEAIAATEAGKAK